MEAAGDGRGDVVGEEHGDLLKEAARQVLYEVTMEMRTEQASAALLSSAAES